MYYLYTSVVAENGQNDTTLVTKVIVDKIDLKQHK